MGISDEEIKSLLMPRNEVRARENLRKCFFSVEKKGSDTLLFRGESFEQCHTSPILRNQKIVGRISRKNQKSKKNRCG